MYNKFLSSNHLIKPKEFGKSRYSSLICCVINFKKIENKQRTIYKSSQEIWYKNTNSLQTNIFKYLF